MRVSLTRQPPAGSPVPLAGLWGIVREREPAPLLVAGLGARLGGSSLTLHRSGREALRVALDRLARQSGRGEVLVPAYTCYSVAAAAVAAGLRVRLVDVTPAGQVDLDALARLPLERAAALVVTNLFGVAEPVAEALRLLRAAGAAVVDDAAQALGARSAEGPAGARADLGVLSFGRGKPLSGLGGGALVTRGEEAPDPTPPSPARASAVARALAYDVALAPFVFRWLSFVPGLHVGETVFDPEFPRGSIDGSSLCLAADALLRFDDDTRERRARADSLAGRIEAEARFTALRARPGDEGAYPRLALLAPTREARDAALAALRDLGATRQYPASLDEVPALGRHLVGRADYPGAHRLCDRLLTLPTHRGLGEAAARRIVAALAGLA